MLAIVGFFYFFEAKCIGGVGNLVESHRTERGCGTSHLYGPSDIFFGGLNTLVDCRNVGTHRLGSEMASHYRDNFVAPRPRPTLMRPSAPAYTHKVL